MDLNTVLKSTQTAINNAVEHVDHDFAGVRTGKASPQLVEGINISVSIYGGTQMKLKQLAAISTPDARTIYVQPHDPSTLQDCEKGMRESNTGLNPIVDGKRLRVPIPELTGERRLEMVKIIKGMAEQGKIQVRNARRDGNDAIKKLQKDSLITEDDLKRGEKEIQNMTDAGIKKIDTHLSAKEKEIMTV